MLNVFRGTFEQLLEKLRETFWKISSKFWKALVLIPLLIIIIIIISIDIDVEVVEGAIQLDY